MIEPYIGDPGDEHDPLPLRDPMNWYRDEEGYEWPTPAEGRVLIDSDDANAND